MMNNEIILSWDNIYWNTRGKLWGFQSLAIPNNDISEDEWFKFVEKIFKEPSNDKPVKVNLHNYTCVAYRFIPDEENKDNAGRKIPHEFMLLIANNIELKEDWYLQLYNQLKESYQKIAALSEEELEQYRGQELHRFLIDEIKKDVHDIVLEVKLELPLPPDEEPKPPINQEIVRYEYLMVIIFLLIATFTFYSVSNSNTTTVSDNKKNSAIKLPQHVNEIKSITSKQ